MPIEYTQTIVANLDITLGVGDIVEFASGVEIEPLFFEFWPTETLANTGGHDPTSWWNVRWDIDATIGPPNNAFNGAPHMQVRWDEDGVWRNVDTVFPLGGYGNSTEHGNGYPNAVAWSRPSSTTTVSFRVANDADPTGLFSPRTLVALTLSLYGVQQDPVTQIYTQVVFGLPLALQAGTISGRGGSGTAKTRVVVVG